MLKQAWFLIFDVMVFFGGDIERGYRVRRKCVHMYAYIYLYMGVSKNRDTPKTPQNDHF